MGRKYEQHEEGEVGCPGWSRWISPIHGHGKKNYRMACCDCSLIHELQFRAKKDTKGRISVIFRVNRNNRATAASRRHRGFNTRK